MSNKPTNSNTLQDAVAALQSAVKNHPVPNAGALADAAKRAAMAASGSFAVSTQIDVPGAGSDKDRALTPSGTAVAGAAGAVMGSVVVDDGLNETPLSDMTMRHSEAPSQASPTAPASLDSLQKALKDPALHASISAMSHMLRQAQDNAAAASRGEIDDPTKASPSPRGRSL